MTLSGDEDGMPLCPECGLVLSAASYDAGAMHFQHSDYHARKFTDPCVVVMDFPQAEAILIEIERFGFTKP